MLPKTRTLLQATAIGCALTFGSLGATAVMAQDATEPPIAQAVTEPEDEGFDDWGLLGLLGLLGLAGLKKRSEPEVRTVDRPVVGTQR
ncbi:MAG: WGxxGxxG-CTERM domain-containing protein [Chloroflexia bacterium]|nr:WGxxGxxG-CTERM domain-containing protein [Chloroflexia bacterium]